MTGKKGIKMYFAIEIIGYGKNTKYAIKSVIPKVGTNPVNGKVYRTEAKAREAAAELEIVIEKCGDYYSII